MIFNNWEYIKDNKGARIIPDSEIPLPKSFIKYYSLNNHNVDAFTNEYLFFSHPLTLNDPFDSCRQLLSLERFSERQFVKLHEQEQRFVTPDFNYSLEEIKFKIAKYYREDKNGLLDSFLTIYWNLIFKDWGTLSLTEINNDMLMWSYYTNHLGFALEFDNQLFDSKKILGAFPINYTETYKTIFPRSIKPDIEHLLYFINVKSTHWRHEKEWRFIVNSKNMSIPDYEDPILNHEERKVKYQTNKVKSIILGYKFFKENVTDTNYGKYKKLYRFHPDTNKNDKKRLKIIDHIINNNIRVSQIEIAEDNTFSLDVKRIQIICSKKMSEYFVEYEKPISNTTVS